MTTCGAGGTPFASMLHVMVNDARSDVEAGTRQLADIVRRYSRQSFLTICIREAVRQLYRTYVTLAGEVTLLGGPGAGAAAGLERITRRHLVNRIHQTGGDFALIDRMCRSLASMADQGTGVAETERVLRRWANREVHLFRILVPLANFAEELSSDVTMALSRSGTSGALLDACLRNAHRSMAPAFRELSLTARSLQRFAQECEVMMPRMASAVASRSATDGERRWQWHRQ
jgi:hypothetical protein